MLMRMICLVLMFGGGVAIGSSPTALPQDATPQKPAGDSEPAASESPDDAGSQDDADEDFTQLNEEEAVEKVKQLAAQFDESLAEFRENLKAATPEERTKMRAESPQPGPWADKFVRLAELFPNSPAAGDALLWVVQRDRGGSHYERALETLIENHGDLEALRPIVAMLQYRPPSAKTEETFESFSAKASNPELRAVLALARLQYQKRIAEMQNSLLGNEARAKQFEQAASPEQLKFIMDFKPLSVEERLANLEKLGAESGDVEISKGRTIGSIVEGELFEARHLQIGMVAPDIEGEDIDATPFKLSDYRGKIVVLDFWGDW